MKEDDVVVVSSDSEEDEEIVWRRKNQNKQYQLLSEKIKPILYYQVQPGYKLSTSFPYARFQELANDLKKSLALVNVKSTQAFIWKNFIRWLVSIKLCYENVSDCINDRNYNLILTDFMAQYVNYKCQLYSSITDETEVALKSNEIVITLSLVFSGWVPGILMTLLKIQVIDDYRLILYPIFKKYLSNKHLHETKDLISYLRLILCFRKWKKLAHLKEDKEIINEIAVGKSAKALRSDVIDLSTETSNIEPVLPKTVPSVNEDNRSFANITGLIGFASKNQEYGTRILLINKTLELDDTIEQFFKRYNEYINRGTPKLLECSRVGLKPTLIEDLTRSPSPDQLLPRASYATRETSQIVNKNKSNGKQGTKAVNQHLSNDCDISSISINNKFNHLNLNSHIIENLSPSCKNIPQNRNNDVVLSLSINNVVDIVDDEDDNNEKDTCKNSNANSMNAFEKRITEAINSLKDRAILVGDLVNRVNVERINNPVVAAISSDETAQTSAESPAVQAAVNNVVAPIPNQVPMRSSPNPQIEVPVEKPIRKRHGIVSSTTSFEGTGNDSDNSDDDDGFGAQSRFLFSQRSFYKVVEEATSSTNEIPKTPSNFANQPRRSISSSPCPTRPSSPSPDRWSNISPSSTIRSGCLSRLGIAAGTSITAGKTISSVTDEEHPTCSRYVAMPVLAASLPNHEDKSTKESVQNPPLEKISLIDKEFTTSINIVERSASATNKSKNGEGKCKNVSEVDANTCAVNELLKNITGFVGELEEEYGFESSKNKCGPDKSPAVISETCAVNELLKNIPDFVGELQEECGFESSKNKCGPDKSSAVIPETPLIVEKTKKNSDIPFEKDVAQQVNALKNVSQQSIVLFDAKNDSKNTKGNTEINEFQENSTEITSVENSMEKDLNDENEKESLIDKPSDKEPVANTNHPESNTNTKFNKDEVVTTIEYDKKQEQSREVVNAENSLKSINEEIRNKIYLTGVYSNIRHEEIVDKMSITQEEKSKPFADDENLFEAIVEDESSSIDDIESPPYELICQNDSLDTHDNKEKRIENDDCMKTSEQMVSKNTKNVDQAVKNNSEEKKDGSSETSVDIELNNAKFDHIKCRPQHLEEEIKLNTIEKVLRNVSQNHFNAGLKSFEAEKTVSKKQGAKNENIDDNRPKIFVEPVELKQKQLNTKNLPKHSEDEKLQIEKIINSDHDYVTVKYSSSFRNDDAYETLKKVQNFDDKSKACSLVELAPESESGHCSHQILDSNTNFCKQENNINDREINEIIETEENFYKDTHEKINNCCQKDQGAEDLTVIYDTILTTCQSDDQQDQEDKIAEQLNNDEIIENQTFDDDQTFNEDQLCKRQKSYDESFIEKADEKLENLTSGAEQIGEEESCIEKTDETLENLTSDAEQIGEEESFIEKTDEPLENLTSDAEQIGEEQCFTRQLTIFKTDKNNGEYKEPINKSPVIDHINETIEQQTINDTEFNKDQNSDDNITPVDSAFNAEDEVTVNITDEKKDKKEPIIISEAIDRKEEKNIDENQSVTKQTTDLNLFPSGSKFNGEHELTVVNSDETKIEVNITPPIIFSAIYKTNKECIEKEHSDAKEIEENRSVIQQFPSDKNVKPIDIEFDEENILTVASENETDNMDFLKVCPQLSQNHKTAKEQTSNVKTYNRKVTPILNKPTVEKETEHVSNKEILNTSPTFDQTEKETEKQTINIKELHESQSCPEQKTSKENVTPVKIQFINETTANRKYDLENSFETEPLKLPQAIEHKVIFQNTKTQDTAAQESSSKLNHESEGKMEIINDEIRDSLSSTKNLSEMQKSSSSLSNVVKNYLEVLTTDIKTSTLPPKEVDKTLVSSLVPSSESIYKSQPLQSQPIHNEANSPLKVDSRRKLIIRIAKLPILEDELFKSRTEIVNLKEQKLKQATNVKITEKTTLKKNKSSKKSERKKIKKAKKHKQVLQTNISEDEVKELINLPTKDSKIIKEKGALKLNASKCIIIQSEIQKTTIEENADTEKYEETKTIVMSKNSTECKSLVKEENKKTDCELSAVCGEKMYEQISTKKKKNTKNKPKPNLKAFEEEKIQKFTKITKDSNLLTEDHVFKFDALKCSDHQRIDGKKSSYVKEKNEKQITCDKSVPAIDTDINEKGKDKIPIKRTKAKGIDLNDESTKKQTFVLKNIEEDQSVTRKEYSEENASVIDTDFIDGDKTSASAQKDETIEKRIVDVAEIHHDQSNENITQIFTQDKKITDSEHYLESRDKKVPLKISTEIEQKVNFANKNAQDTFIKEWSSENCHERENKMEMINDEIHNSLNSTKIFSEMQKCSFPSTNIVDICPEIQTTDVKSSSLSPKAEESLDKSGTSQNQEINDELHSPIQDESIKKLIIRIPKLSVLKDVLPIGSEKEASVLNNLTLKLQKHLKGREHSGECQKAKEKSTKNIVSKNNKSSKKSDKQKIKANKPKPILKTKSLLEEQVCKLDASECISIQTENENTATRRNTDKDQYEICKPKVSIVNSNEHRSPAEKESASELSIEDVEKTKISTKKKKSVTFKIQGTIYKREHSSQEQVPVLKLDASKCLTTSIELGDIKRELDESVVDPVTIENSSICRKKISKILTDEKSDTKTKKAKINKPKLSLNTKKKEIVELIKIPTNDSSLSHGDDQVIKLNASESISIQIENDKTDNNDYKGQSEKNKATVENNVTELKSFVNDIFEKSAVKKNIAKSIEISKISFQQESHQKLNSKLNIESSTEEPILKKNNVSYETSTLSISKPSTEIEILQKPKGINDTVKRSTKDTDTNKLLPTSVVKASSLDSFAKSVKFAECQTEPKSTLREQEQICSSKCQKLSDVSSTAPLNSKKWETNVLQNIVQCKDELIKNRNQEVFSQIRHAKLENSIEPDSSSQVAKELQRTENTLTEEESNLSTRVQVADLGEPSLISDSEISQQNASVALESDKSIVFYPSRDSAEDQEVSFITSQENDNNIYYSYNDGDSTPVMDEKNSTEDESPLNQRKITSLNEISDLICQKPQLTESTSKPNLEPTEHELKPISIDNVKECNVSPDKSVTPFWDAADENLELWLKKLGISKNCTLNRGMNVSNSNSTKLDEKTLETQKNDRKQKKPQRVEKNLNFEDFNAAAILTSLKDCQQKMHRSRKGLQPTRITRSASHIVEAESILQDNSQQIISPISSSENLYEKERLDNLNIIEKSRSPSIQNHSELTQSNVSSDSDDIGKLVIDFDAKRLTKPKTKEKPKSKKNKIGKAKGITSPKTALKKNKESINQSITEIIDKNPCILKRCRGRPKVLKDSPIKNPQATTATQSRKETPKQKSLDKSKTHKDKDEQVEKNSLQKKDKLRLSIDIPLGIPKLIEERNEEPRTSSNYESCTSTLDNMNQETWLKNFTLRKNSKSLDSEVKQSSGNVSMVKKILSEQNLLLIPKTDVDFLNTKTEESEKVSEILIEPNKTKDDQNKTNHDIHEVTDVAAIPSLKEPIKDIEKQIKPLKIDKQLKGDKLSKCIRRLSIEEKPPKKPKMENKKPAILEDQTTSVTIPTLKTVHIEESKQSNVSSKNVDKPPPNSTPESTNHSELVLENKTVTTPETNIDKNEIKDEEKPTKIELKNLEQILSIDETLINSVQKFGINEVDKQCKTTPEKVDKSTEKEIHKIGDLMETPEKVDKSTEKETHKIGDLMETSEKVDKSTEKEIHKIGDLMETSEKVDKSTEKEIHKIGDLMETLEKVDKSTEKEIHKIGDLMETKDTAAISSKVSILKEELSYKDMDSNDVNSKVKPKSYKRVLNFDSPLSSDPLSTIITNTASVDEPKNKLLSSIEEVKLKNSVFPNADLEATSNLIEKNIPSIEKDANNLVNLKNIPNIEKDANNAQFSKSVAVETPNKKDDEVTRVLDISISKILGPKMSNITDRDTINIIAEESIQQESIVQLGSKDNNYQSVTLDNEQIIKKSMETFPKPKRPSLSEFQRRRSNSTSDVPSESIEVENFFEFQRDYFLELNGENFNDTREDQSSQLPVTPKAEPASLDCMLSGNRGQDDEYNLGKFNTALALEPVPTFSPDENVENLYSFDDLSYSLSPPSTLINGSLNVSGCNSDSGEKTNPDIKKTEFTTKELKTDKTPFEEGKNSAISENQTIDVRTSEYELNNCTTNVSSADVILMNPPEIISCLKTKPIKSPVVKIFYKTTPEKKNSTEEFTDSIIQSKLKSSQKPFWKVVQDSSESTKLDSSTSVISSVGNPYPTDDVPVDFVIFEEKDTKPPIRSDIVTETNLYKVDSCKKSFLDSMSIDDRFDRIKNESSVNTCMNKTSNPVIKQSSPIKSDVNSSRDLCQHLGQLDKPKSQSISIISSIPSISTQLCEQKDEANKSISLTDQKNLYSINSSHSVKKTASYNQKDETKKSVLELNSLKKPCLLKEIDETKKSCEQIAEAEDHLRNTVLHADNNLYSKKRQSRIPSVKNSTEKVLVSQISEKNTHSKHLTSTISSVTSVSSVSSISTSLGTPTVLDFYEHKISSKGLCPKKSTTQNLAIQSSDQSEKINSTQPTTENKNIKAFKLSLNQDPLSIDAKTEIPSKVCGSKALCPKNQSLAIQTPDQSKNINPIQPIRSEISSTSISVEVVSSKSSASIPVVSSIHSISKSSGTPRILDRCDTNNSSKSSCSKRPVDQSFVIKTLDTLEKINETRPTPLNNNVVGSKQSLKRHSQFSDAKLVHEPPSKIFCSEISTTSVPVAVVSSFPSISSSSVTPTILNQFEQKISGKMSCSKKPLKLNSGIKTPDPSVKTNAIQSTLENKNVEASKPSLKIPYSNLTTSSPNASYGIAQARNQKITKPIMLEKTSAVLPTSPFLPRQKSIETVTSVSLPSQSPRTYRTIPPVHTTEKAISITFRKSTTPSSTPGKSDFDKPKSTTNHLDTARSNNKPSNIPKSTSSSTSVTRPPNSWSADLARLSADLEIIKKHISQLPAIDKNFKSYRERKSLLEELKTKQEELNDFKKRHQEYVNRTHVLKSHSERKPFDRDHKQHHHQQHNISNLQQPNGLKRKHDQLRPHSEHQFSKSSTSGHSSHVERQKQQSRVYVNKFSELDKFHFSNKIDQSIDTKPEVKKLPPWDPKPSNADDIIRTLRGK